MAMTVTQVSVCDQLKMKPKITPKMKPNGTGSGTGETTQIVLPKPKPVFKPKTNQTQTQTQTQKAKPVFKPKNQITAPTVKVTPKPASINTQTEEEPDSDVEDDEITFYHRWINGIQLLISTDNRHIYDPETFEHLGEVLDESIQWD